MNAHPVLAEIIASVTKLAPELPIIRHHHEWYNGSATRTASSATRSRSSRGSSTSPTRSRR